MFVGAQHHHCLFQRPTYCKSPIVSRSSSHPCPKGPHVREVVASGFELKSIQDINLTRARYLRTRYFLSKEPAKIRIVQLLGYRKKTPTSCRLNYTKCSKPAETRFPQHKRRTRSIRSASTDTAELLQDDLKLNKTCHLSRRTPGDTKRQKPQRSWLTEALSAPLTGSSLGFPR